MIAKVVILIFLVPGAVWLICRSLKDLYKYPLCPKCKKSFYCERNEAGRAICSIHGDVTDCDLIKNLEED
jgi:hypothetical protein